jgi:hypothetical protein
MQQVIKFLSDYEVIVYIILGIMIVFAFRKLVIALNESKNSVFGLERESAQKKVTSAVTMIVLVGLFAITEFIIATFLISELPQKISYATPTMVLELTPSATKPLAKDETPQPTATPYPQAALPGIASNCQENILEFTFPAQGESVSGVVELLGNVNTPNFGSYKYEYSPSGEINWVTIAAGGEIRENESLGYWFTGSLTPGDYLLKLVALDNQGNEQTPCIVNVRVVPEE